MASRFSGRYTGTYDGDFVVFLIGMRVFNPWMLWRWLWVAKAMNAMQIEIARNPEIGCLHIENFGVLRGVSVQYWVSFDHLEQFARSRQWSHLEAWRAFNKVINDSGKLGIWHETYAIRNGDYETFYGNMPVFGLAAAGSHARLDAGSSASQRMGRGGTAQGPIEGT